MSRAKVSLSSNCVQWTAELIGSEEAPHDRIICYIHEDNNYRNAIPREEINCDHESDGLMGGEIRRNQEVPNSQKR